ncbi:OmpA family protein [Novosphingobium aquimarinum]|uniref:OmpA family protein n=1 Tax=Novosphingobium aquimarinum TaxID=2682494 RepID=UPI0012EBB040|nr:OmpA family protein [Novosphingobium aquimarinum]
MSEDERKDSRAEQFRTVFRPSPLQDESGEQAPLFGNLADPAASAPKAPPPAPKAPPAPVAPIYEQPAGYGSGKQGSVLPWILSALLLIALGFMVVRYVILAPDPNAAPTAPAEAVPAMGAQAERLSAFLAPEIGEELVAVEEDAETVRVNTAQNLFEPGSADFTPGRRALFERIGKALEQENAKFITVEGYTGEGQEPLARSRADAVAAVLRESIADNRRIEATGIAGDPGGERIEIVIERQDDGAGS